MLKTLDFWSTQNARNISDSEQMWASDGGDSEASRMRRAVLLGQALL